MTDRDVFAELTEQLRDDVGAVAGNLVALLGPSAEPRMLEQLVNARAEMWAANLLGDDDRLAAQTVIDLACVLFPGDAAPGADWWRTPLGQAAARSTGAPAAETVSYSVAGAMLGCSKQYIGKLVGDGRLRRGGNGGVTMTSVRAILNRTARSGSRRTVRGRKAPAGSGQTPCTRAG